MIYNTQRARSEVYAAIATRSSRSGSSRKGKYQYKCEGFEAEKQTLLWSCLELWDFKLCCGN